jgi:ATP-binding cassette subfamily B protein
MQALLGFGLVAWLLFDYLGHGGEAGGVLLLVYWALNLPVLGQEMTVLVCQYPGHRNVTLRLLEPLGALEDTPLPEPAGEMTRQAHDLVFRYRARGEPVLRGISLRLGAGERILLQGPSGGGKSTLVTLLTGLRRPESGLLLLGGLDQW